VDITRRQEKLLQEVAVLERVQRTMLLTRWVEIKQKSSSLKQQDRELVRRFRSVNDVNRSTEGTHSPRTLSSRAINNKSEDTMSIIDAAEEAARDWDWFAVDPQGRLGHFTTAGMRPLPKTVKQDREAALKLIDYFFEKAPKSVPHTVCPEVEKEAGGWKNDSARDWYLKDFILMASAGLFSHNTHVSGPSEDYFTVACPTIPLLIDQLPPEIRDLVKRIESPFSFAESVHIPAAATRDW